MDAVAATNSVVVVAVLAALLRSPTREEWTPWPQALNEDRSRIRWAPLVDGFVLLVSACKVALPNVEGSGLTRMGRGQRRWWKCRPRPLRENAVRAFFRYYRIELQGSSP